jgi:hypothetical protein
MVVLVGQVEQFVDEVHATAIPTSGTGQTVSQQFQAALGSSVVDSHAVRGCGHQQRGG